MNTDTIAEIIHDHIIDVETPSPGGYHTTTSQEIYSASALIDALADHFAAEDQERCPVIYAGGFCLDHLKRWNPDNFKRIATGVLTTPS